MSAPARLFRNACQSATAARLLAGLAAAGLLSGCVANPIKESAIDPTSPVAGEVAKVARHNTDFPSFSEIPAKPNDVRPLKMFGQAAADVELAAAELERNTAPETWSLQETDAFADRARRDAGPEIAPADPRDTEAFADELRKRATPPPPPKR